MATYKRTLAGLERELPICKVNDKLDIAGFVIFGDVEMTVAAAGELLKKCPEFDFIVAPEAKAIPLAHEMARQSGKPDSAMAGAKDVNALPEAVKKAEELLAGMLK